MLEKGPLVGRFVEVTFRMPALEGTVELYLCGEFNNWNRSGAPLVQESDGTWVTTLALEAGRSYRFRYYDNQGRWHNDWKADSYVDNGFGEEDSVVDLTKVTAAPAGSRAPALKQGAAKASKKAVEKSAEKAPPRRPVPRAAEVKKGGEARRTRRSK